MSCIRHKAFRSHAAVIFIYYNERRDLVSGVAFILTCSHMTAYDKNIKQIFTFMHLADEFIYKLFLSVCIYWATFLKY